MLMPGKPHVRTNRVLVPAAHGSSKAGTHDDVIAGLSDAGRDGQLVASCHRERGSV